MAMRNAVETGGGTNRKGGSTDRKASTARGDSTKDLTKKKKKPKGSALDGIAEGAPSKAPAKASALKAITTGMTGVIDFIGEHEVAPGLEEEVAPSSSAAPDEGSGGEAPKQLWAASKWLAEISDKMNEAISQMLCTSSDGETVLEDEEALAHVRAIESQDVLIERLLANGVAQRLAAAIWPKLEILQAGPATASELANQWAEEGAGDLLYGGLPSFFSGLEARIGSPDPKVFKDMEQDHCGKPDSHIEFTTGNYSVVTTSDIEWKFVAQPETQIRWPIEERLANAGNNDHMRKLLPCAILERRMDMQNRRLDAIGADLLTWAEVVGGRLYTGPLFVKYNGLLRGLDSPVPFLKNSMIQLCCPKDVYERFIGTAKLWQNANGTMPYEKARKELNFYTTTIHVINSCIVKMGKLTKAQPVYRGMSGRIFPEQFWKPNSQGVMGGVEFAFMSTTPDRSVAEQYSQDGFGIIVEIQQGMIDRGAEIAWLSQYPHEAEILFAPLAGLEMRELRIDSHPLNGKHIIVASMRISINLTNPTIEQVIAKRRKICTDMGKGLIMEMRSALNKKGSNETEAYLRLMQGLMEERPLSHESTWYNDDPCFQEAVNETLRLKREVMNVPTLETKKLEGDAVAQLLGETLATKPKVEVVPDITFNEFKNLKVLNLDGFAGLHTLPTTIGLLSDLHTLHLRECEALEHLPPELGKLRKLSTLNLTSCKELLELPSQIGNLVALTSLDLGFCRALTSLPPEMGRLGVLHTLKLQQCSGLTELPASLGHLHALKILTLYGCSALTAIPDSLATLPELQELNLRACSGILQLPSTFGANLPALTTLDLTLCKGLTWLPDTIGQLVALQTLFLGNCFNIPQLPATITALRSLVTMNLYNCGGLKYLPDTFDELENLQVLSLQGCEKLIEVPESLTRCATLNTLTLWNCQVLEKLPDLSIIPKLQIDGVPEQLADWEAEFKRKRAEIAKGGGAQAQKTDKAQGWAAVKKSVSQATTAAQRAGMAKSREELNAMPAAYETQGGNKTNRGGGSTARKAEGGAAQPAGGE